MKMTKTTEPASRGIWYALGAALIMWIPILGCLSVALAATGCTARGSWEYGGVIPLLGEWKVYGNVTPPKEGDLPTVVTFEDKIFDWIVGPVVGQTGEEGTTEAVKVATP